MAKTEFRTPERLRKKLEHLRNPMRRIPSLTPGWKGASIALAITACSIYLVQAYYLLGSRGLGDYLIGTFLSVIAIGIITGLLAGLLSFARRMPSRYVWLALASFCLLFVSFIGPIPLMFIVTLSIIVSVSLLGALLAKWITGRYREVKRVTQIIAGIAFVLTVGIIGIGSYWLLHNGNPELDKPYRLQTIKPAERYLQTMLNPAEQGPFAVQTLSYGSANSYRQQFNAEGSLITKQVDGSAFVKNWSTLRTNTFGFGPDQMPLNGLVWYPVGQGTFPLVLIVHGNHTATEYSDPGYEYLGKLLASRGYIVASIDENFLNTSLYDDLFILHVLEKENPARGWLMLEHLKAWEAWNHTKGNPFFGQVDMDRIAIIGHSRGGEAVTVAAAYNKLPASPENGNVKFQYNFGIRSVISIAPTDGQYKPAGQPTTLQDVNYLAIQGAHDMDVSSFDGASQYHRIRFSDRSDDFKASVYIYGANHGQFNTVWGRTDGAGLGNKLFNTAQLMPIEEQLQAAKVLISSFLDATLRGKNEYRSMFQDLGYARTWLPDTMYISNYADAKTTIISNYDEDIDLGTTTLPGGKFIGENLEEWKEEKVEMKFITEQYSAVRIGWDRKKASGVPRYTVVLPPDGIRTQGNASVVFAMADRNDGPTEDNTEAPVDVSIQVEDRQGNKASLPLSSAGSLLPMFEGNIVKWPFMGSMPTKEPIFQNFTIKLADLKKVNPNFQPELLTSIRFLFDRTERGTVLIRDIGLRN
ncbi:MFS transporter [Paenibacillus guangzhouensis]|uniref:MFS transporter n=1 Tax=Paenibacillus guangzhouensis TaxID=1473112 RepID=UPI0012672C72|nr:MFS transporter [Paenibacillus guangzhouensis]